MRVHRYVICEWIRDEMYVHLCVCECVFVCECVCVCLLLAWVSECVGARTFV
jgi:hypothetical protein